MNSVRVFERLKREYPGKKIMALPESEPTEILCEVEPSADHPEYSVAISVIDKSVPHHHIKSTEIYTILEGELSLMIDGKTHHLKEGESIIIPPNAAHSAVGNETWVSCRSEPGWTFGDHIF
jgi:quercetin dioxygenase-like cupin family protein